MVKVEYMLVTLPSLYPWVLMIVGMISFECLIVGFVGSGNRRKIFSKEMMKEHFREAHWDAFKQEPPGGGYPDHGNGFYSTKLSYKDWYEFQLAQRSHKNLLEFVTVVVCSILIVGVVFPITSLVLGSIYLITAIIYKIGFTLSPEKRILANMIR